MPETTAAGMNAKPLDSIKGLGEIIKDHPSSHALYLRKNQRMDFDLLNASDAIYYLESGKISAYRVSDNVLTISQHSPSIVGLIQLRSAIIFHYFRCDSDCILWGMKKNDIEALYSENPVSLRYAYDALSYMALIYHERDLMVLKGSIKKIVIEHLYQIWEISEKGRINISVYTFILSRNKIARSSVHRVITSLIANNCIAVEQGRLVMFNESMVKNMHE
jgi:CRP-like cAMP-binding protein